MGAPTFDKNCSFDLYSLAYEKIKKAGEHGIISFRVITKTWGVLFHLSRYQSFRLMKEMERRNWIQIHPFNGVSIIKR